MGSLAPTSWSGCRNDRRSGSAGHLEAVLSEIKRAQQDDLISGGRFTHALLDDPTLAPQAGRVFDEESEMETKPAPRCRHCGQTLRRMRLISELYRLRNLQVFECADCDTPHSNASGESSYSLLMFSL
jgi:hypothetical protein